jgi:hypothetical protein
MIGRFFRWLRLTLPPAVVVVLAIFILLVWEGLYLWLRWRFGTSEIAHNASTRLLDMRDKYAAFIMVAYGIWRAAAFHPLFRPKYRAWLEQTPWTSASPLPLGPIHLVWQDILVVGLLSACLHGTPCGRIWVLEAFLIAHQATIAVSFWLTGPWWMGYVVVFALGLAVRLFPWPLACVGVLAILCVLTAIGCRLALARFPWQECPLLEAWNRQCSTDPAARRKSLLGWPYGQLAAVPPERQVRRRDGLLGPLLAAWWIYIAASTMEPKDRIDFVNLVFLGVSAAAVWGRVMIYTLPWHWPISVWGRIATGRWIIPGYDYVFLAPLCTLCVALACFRLGLAIGPGSWQLVFCPAATAAVLIVALNMSPSLGHWRLTGHHRIMPWGSNDARRVKL